MNGRGAVVARDEDRSHPVRFDPAGAGGTLMDSDHRGRYHWAAQLVEDRSVLDVACGTGYGAQILGAAGALKVTGLDIDEEALDSARQRYGADGIEFMQGDLSALELPDDSVDLAICFETIEHLDDPAVGIEELRRVVGPGGLIVVSSPNPSAYPPGNPHHKRELEPTELLGLVGAHFDNVALHLQHSWLASLIEAMEPGGDPRFLRFGRRATEEVTFSLVVGSDQELEPMTDLLSLGDSFEVRWWEEQISLARDGQGGSVSDDAKTASLEERLIDQQREAARALRSAEERERQVRTQLKDTGAALLEANQELAEAPLLKHRLAELYRENAELEELKNTILNSRSWRWTRSLRSMGAFLRLNR